MPKEDIVENNEEEESVSGLLKFRSAALSIMLLMISMGQWNDTKDVAVAVYEEVISRFTNNLQYQKLLELRIGYTVDYTRSILGEPRVIKPIRSIKGAFFSYYSAEKYLVVTASKGERVTGFSVYSSSDDFAAPIVYLDENLKEQTLGDYFDDSADYATDFGNSDYFFEMAALNHQQMFYEFSVGSILNGSTDKVLLEKVRKLNHQLNQGEEPLLEDLVLPSLVYPNYYSVSEFSSEIMHESILSKYEFKFLFGH